MGTPRATLGGITLTNASAVGWTQTAGTQPNVQVFTVHESNWDAMLSLLGQEVSLVIQSDTAPTLRWDCLFPLREAIVSQPFLRGIMVSDVRWKWPYEIIARSYNVARKTGDRRLTSGSPVEIRQDFDYYKYARASLKGRGGDARKWLARDVIDDVMGEVSAKCGHPYRIDGLSVNDTKALTVENLELADGIDSALARVLRMIPQSLVTIDRHGVAVVFDGTDVDLTEQIMADAGPQTVAGNIDRVVNLDAMRPKRVHVYFSKEVELRFDSQHEDDDLTRPDTIDNPDMTIMDNVLPLPDPITVINGDDVPQGTWKPIYQVIKAWNLQLSDLGKAGVTPPPLTFTNIRKYWFILESLYTPLGNLTNTAAQSNWVSRIAALRLHFRQTYQIPKDWMYRIRDIRPVRLGAIDPDTTARAPSQAWTEYCVEPTPKAYVIAALQNNPDLKFYWLNVDNYPGVNVEVWDKAASPATVEVLDRDLGILHLNYRGEAFGMRGQIHPSQMKNNATGKLQSPGRDLRSDLEGVVCMDGVVTGAVPIGLSDDYRIAFIITAMPFSPNSESRYYRQTVEPSEVARYLPPHFQVSGGTGPDRHIVVPPSLVTAWYAWNVTKDARENAPFMFGFYEDSGAGTLNEMPGFELLNAGGYSDQPPLILAWSNAVAAAQWASYTNHREGTRAVHMNPEINLAGNIDTVGHALDPSGRLLTTVSMRSVLLPMDPFSLLPNYSRPWILGTIFDKTP